MGWINVGRIMKTNYAWRQFLYQPANPLYYKYKGLASAVNFKAKVSSVINAENVDVYDIGQSRH
jgi:hypothetical protein